MTRKSWRLPDYSRGGSEIAPVPTLPLVALPTGGTVTPSTIGNKVHVDLPKDPNLGGLLWFRVQTATTAQPAAPVGASPTHDALAANWTDKEAPAGKHCHYFVVPVSKERQPISPIASNFYYVGGV